MDQSTTPTMTEELFDCDGVVNAGWTDAEDGSIWVRIADDASAADAYDVIDVATRWGYTVSAGDDESDGRMQFILHVDSPTDY